MLQYTCVRKLVGLQHCQPRQIGRVPCLPGLLFVCALTWLNGAVQVHAAVPSPGSQIPHSPPPPGARVAPRISGQFGKFPLSFEPNLGQVESGVHFLSRGRGLGLMLRDASITLSLGDPQKSVPVRMQILGGRTHALTGEAPLPGKVNDYRGRDPGHWLLNIPTYSRVRYKEVYPGVDLVFYGAGGRLEYDVVVSPGADPARMRLGIQGNHALKADPSGDLVLQTASGELRWQKPHAYQQVNGHPRYVPSRYHVQDGQVTFQVAHYDRTRSLVIDPVLVYSTTGVGGRGIAIDAAGNAYITMAASTYVSITRLNPSGTQVLNTTYLNGNIPYSDTPVVLDANGNVQLAGTTSSANFPVTPAHLLDTPGALYPTMSGGNDAFVAKLNGADLSLNYCTFLGGTNLEHLSAIAVDTAGNTWVAGGTNSSNFPTTGNAVQPYYAGGNGDAFITGLRLDRQNPALLYSTYLGGQEGQDTASAITTDLAGNIYASGTSRSTNVNTPPPPPPPLPLPPPYITFPILNARYPTNPAGWDGFLAEIGPDGALLSSSFLGGGTGTAVAVDGTGSVYIAGTTTSTSYVTTQGAYQTTHRGQDGFMTRIVPDGTPYGTVYSTLLGGTYEEVITAIALDGSGNVYLTGNTTSLDYPCVDAIQAANKSTTSNRYDVIVAVLSSSLDRLIFSTYLGGSGIDLGYGLALDASRNIYVTGDGGVPVTSGAVPGSIGHFVSRISLVPNAPTSLSASATSSTQINLTWTNKTINQSQIHVERSTDRVNFTEIAALSGTVKSLADTGLAHNTSYTYRLRADNSYGLSTYSSTASATTRR